MNMLLPKGINFEMEEGQVKECMKMGLNCGCNIKIKEQDYMFMKGLKFTLCYHLKENFYKIMYRWYLSLEKNCLKCIKNTLNLF